MTKFKMLSTALVIGSVFGVSQAALAYQQGDILLRGDVAKSSPQGDDDSAISDESGFVGSVGFMFIDNMAVTLGSSEKFEHDYNANGIDGDFKRRPIDLMVQYYPLGGSDSELQPYAGIGANYTRYSDESSGLRIDNTWAPKAELGLDLAITDYLALNGFASYTNIEPDYSANGMSGELDIDPVTIGGGLTFSF